jgi:HEAT repeat protein
MLIAILTDDLEEDILRRYACDSLGKIGDEKALPHIRSVLSSDDPYLRAYAVSAISNFEGQEVEEILMQALRDSFWRVRVSALESLAETDHTEAIPAMKFKAKHDPEKNVRLEAVESLADMDKGEAWDFLEESLKDQSTPFELRIASAEQLIKKHLDQSLNAIKEVLKTEMEKKNSNLLKYTAKLLFDAKAEGLREIYLNLLNYRDYQVQIYAVWGIEKNGFSDLVPKLEEVIEGAYHPSVKGVAKSAIETLE